MDMIQNLWRMGIVAAGLAIMAGGAAGVASQPGRSGAAPALQLPAGSEASSPAIAVPSHAPRWPGNPEPSPGAPNILLVLTDDVGFGASSTFGGPVPTPHLDALARRGLRYTRFHTTGMCSPTRASLLTGRNPHNVGMGMVTNLPSPFDGYSTVLPPSAATIAELLRHGGYRTAWFGKAHVTPEWETSQAGPFDRWPTGLGFDHFYGFLGADTSMFEPALVRDTTPIDPPQDPDYHFDRDLADRAIGWIREQRALDPGRPFFAYYATGTAHTPHHAPAEWLERFRGRFDAGWDVVREETFARQVASGIVPPGTRPTPRPASLPAWDDLSPDERRFAARLMEAHAAALSHMDEQFGRVVAALEESGELDNTLIIFVEGDNGASGEGTPMGLRFQQSLSGRQTEHIGHNLPHIEEIGTAAAYNNYPAGWAWATNAPFQWTKQIASHLGGIRNGLVVSWPARIEAAGEIRTQFHHVSDIGPTILEAAGVTPPAEVNGHVQIPFDGISMVYSFAAADAADRRRSQIFEMFQNLAIYQDGWWANTAPVRLPWQTRPSGPDDPELREWELYHLEEDFSQSRNLAADQPQRLAAMQRTFWEMAAANNILPVHDALTSPHARPDIRRGRDTFTYVQSIRRVPEGAAPPILGRSFTIRADMTLPADGGSGVIVAHGGRFGGYSLFIWDGQLRFHYNLVGQRRFEIGGNMPVPGGRHAIEARFRIDAPTQGAGGTLDLYVDGALVASGRIDQTMQRLISYTEGFDVGEDSVTPVSDAYTVTQSRFDGELQQVVVQIH